MMSSVVTINGYNTPATSSPHLNTSNRACGPTTLHTIAVLGLVARTTWKCWRLLDVPCSGHVAMWVVYRTQRFSWRKPHVEHYSQRWDQPCRTKTRLASVLRDVWRPEMWATDVEHDVKHLTFVWITPFAPVIENYLSDRFRNCLISGMGLGCPVVSVS
jgi:hypothetical protein